VRSSNLKKYPIKNPAPVLQVFYSTLRFGEVGLDIEVPFRISACAGVAGYIFSTIKEIVGFGIPML